MADPEILDHYCMIVNTSHATLNGQCCLVSSYDPSKFRYTVTAVTGLMPPTKRTLQLKGENLRQAGGMEKRKYEYLKLKPYDLAQDPKFAELRKNGELFQSEIISVASSYNINLSRVIPASLVFLLIHWWFRGFIRTFLLFTLLWYPLMFSLPDLKLKKNILQCLKNIPLNLSSELSRATGYNVTYMMAAIGLGCFYVFGVYTYTTPYVAASAVRAAAKGGVIDQATVDRIYAKGYDDGSAGKPFGTSLEPSDTSPLPSSYDDDMSSPVPPPPLATGLGALGFTHLMSAGLIVKAVYDLGMGPDGVWNPGNVVPNGKANPMRLMMPAFGGYRILKALGVF